MKTNLFKYEMLLQASFLQIFSEWLPRTNIRHYVFFGSGSASFKMTINYWCSYLFRYVKRWVLFPFLTLLALSFARIL